jgi:glutamine synthetase
LGKFGVGAVVFFTSSVVFAEDGVSDRGASIRIPIYSIEHGWKGYLEDRRPASNADSYRVTSRILKNYAEAHQKAIA